MKPLLSILIPSIPSRFEKANALFDSLMDMVEGLDVEILMLTDNKFRTIGEKREALKNISSGKYFMFCDDDDSLYSISEIYEAAKQDVDVITFKVKCRNNSGSDFIVTCGLGNEVEHLNDGNGNYIDLKRPPFTQCAWNEKFKSISFPAINYSEDWEWIKQALERAKTEIHIPKILHGYNFDPMISEASTASNEYWQNPNADVVVNLVTNHAGYLSGQRRLFNSLPKKIVQIPFVGEKTVGAPPHSENNYAFKVYAISEAREHGYHTILWLDASVYAVKSLDPVFNLIREQGYFFEQSGHAVGSWCDDRVLEYFSITRQEAMEMPMLSSGFVGFDFRNEIAIKAFERWEQSMLDGMFNGSWETHRHDQTCLSIIANQLGMKMTDPGTYFAYIGEGFAPPKETAVCHLQGIA